MFTDSRFWWHANRANEVDDETTGKLKEKCLERRVIGDRCDRYGRSGVRGIRRGKAKPTKLGRDWTTRRVPPKVPTGQYHRTWRKPRLWLLYNSLNVFKQRLFCNLVYLAGVQSLRLIGDHQFPNQFVVFIFGGVYTSTILSFNIIKLLTDYSSTISLDASP